MADLVTFMDQITYTILVLFAAGSSVLILISFTTERFPVVRALVLYSLGLIGVGLVTLFLYLVETVLL